MKEWICLNCGLVFRSKMPKCCGDVEEFSLEKHGRSLISKSNSWIEVHEKWKYNKIFQSVSNELAQDGTYGAATAINVTIEKLLNNLKG